ncbi:hypothetical protein L596_021549 [Steinernema carpocapsae]|nr:hypothetical protein L596_021549 [Steinernema carpocapsae]
MSSVELCGEDKTSYKTMTIAFTDLRGTLRTHWKSIYILTVVSIIGVIQMSTVPPQVFPYMRILDPDASPSFYGRLNFQSRSCGLCRAPIVSGKVFAIISCLVYLAVEYFPNTYEQKIVFVVYEIFAGLSIGMVGILRSYVAMASTEEDRSKAISITTMAMPLGIAIGPVIQLIFTKLSYPGLTLPTGGHFNMFTAPVVTAFILNCFGLCLLVVYFKDKTTATRSKGSIRPSKIIVNKDDYEVATVCSVTSTTTTTEEKTPLDWSAISTCLITRLVLGLILINIRVVATPYTMMAFSLTSSQTVFYHSLSMALVGVFGILVHLIYIFFKVAEKISERMACTATCFYFMLFFLITYPWPFLSEKLKSDSIMEILANQDFNITLLDSTENKHPVVLTEKTMECVYSWCDTTPAINFWVYYVSNIILGTGMPIMMINLDILFSKLLGNIKQGTMQGIFMISGDVVNIVGPIILSTVYETSGPTYIWMFLIICTSACGLMWILMYRRMVPYRGPSLQ